MRDTMSPGSMGSPTEAIRSAARVETIARAFLLAMAAGLPFEVPIVKLGPVTITTVECLIYLAIGASTAALLIRAASAGSVAAAVKRARASLAAAGRDSLNRAVVLWLLVIIVSAAMAPAHRVPALKFALRATGGGLLFFAARYSIRSTSHITAMGIAILLGATVSAMGAVVESIFPNTASLWHAFRTTTFTVTGLPRPSGPFGYPTIAAMYWEAALPLAIVIPATARAGARSATTSTRGWTGAAVAMMIAALFVAAILFSATRTALVVAAISSLAMTVLTWRDGRSMRLAAAGALVLVVAVAGMTLVSPAGASSLAIRLRWWQDGSWYLVRYTVADADLKMDAGTLNRIPVTIENQGGLIWPHAGQTAVRLSYHWENTDSRGAHLDFEGRRSPLPIDVPPGSSVRVLGTVQAPHEPGRYRLRWDLVRENVTWFSERGNATADQNVDVENGKASPPPRQGSAFVDSTLEDFVASYSPSRPELWRAALRLWRGHPFLGVGPDNFRRVYPEALAARPKGPDAVFDQRIHANSLYFETLADLGLAGVAALLLLMVAIARTAWRAVFTPVDALSAALAIAVGTFFIHGLLDWFSEFTPTYALYWLLIALLAAGTDRRTAAAPIRA